VSWSVDHVLRWLGSLSLGHLGERFRENGVDGAFLSELELEELVSELGLTTLQAKKVFKQWRARADA